MAATSIQQIRFSGHKECQHLLPSLHTPAGSTFLDLLRFLLPMGFPYGGTAHYH